MRLVTSRAVFLSVVGAALQLAAMADGYAEAPKKPSHRVLREGMFSLNKLPTARVVMLGDSLTEGGMWAEITGCYFLVNRGIAADQSAGVAKRLDEIVKLKPAAVFLMIGVNDVASDVPTEKIVENVRHTIERFTRKGARVYLTLVLPVSAGFPKKINPKIDELNAAYASLGRRANVSLVDFRDQVRAEDGSLREELTTDGVHLTTEGYRVWRDAIEPLVLKHCPVPAAQAQGPGKLGERR
jgi:hypothetical protein